MRLLGAPACVLCGCPLPPPSPPVHGKHGVYETLVYLWCDDCNDRLEQGIDDNEPDG